MDIPDQRDEVSVVKTENGFISRLKQMALSAVASIEGHRVCGQQSLHDSWKRDIPDPDRKMKVIAHEAVGKDRMRRLGFQAKNISQEPAAIEIIDENLSPVDASGHHMIDGAGIMYSWGARHAHSYGLPAQIVPAVE